MHRAVNRLRPEDILLLQEPGLHADGAGLYLRIKPSGSRSWVFLRVRAGRRREMGLGAASVVPLERARQLADEARSAFNEGRDPLAERRAGDARRRVRRFGEFADELIDGIEVGFRNDKHRKQWRSSLQGHAAALSDLPLNEVDTEQVLLVLRPIWARIPETAFRVRGRIERVLDAAKVLGHRSGENPARWKGHLEHLLPKRRDKAMVKHHAALPYPLMSAFMKALRGQDSASAQALAFTILTAARSVETLKMTWGEVDLDDRRWRIPSARMKNGMPHEVPLSASACEVLRMAVRAGNRPESVVFANAQGAPLSNMSMLMLLRRMGYQGITVHGFRSTFRDWAGELTDFHRETIEMALAHSIASTTERAYRRARAFRKRRDLMDAWGEHCGF
jgi:integrase